MLVSKEVRFLLVFLQNAGKKKEIVLKLSLKSAYSSVDVDG